MLPINHNGGAGQLASPITLDDRFVPAVLALVCLASGWGSNIYQTQSFVMVIAAFCALGFILSDRIIAAVVVYLSIWYMALFAGTTTEPAVIASSLHLVTAALVVYAAVRLGTWGLDRHLDVILSVSCILAALGIVGYLTGRPAVATLGNQNFLGAFLAIGAFSAFRKKRARYLTLILPALWFCSSSTPIAAFCAGLGFYLWRWKGVSLGVILGALYFFTIDNGSLIHTDRVDFWLDAWTQVSASPWTLIFGMGPGVLWNPGVNMLHSEYAYLLWNLGGLGLLLAALYIRRAFRVVSDPILAAMLVAVLVDAIGNHLFHTVPTALLAVAVFALNDRTLEA